MIGGRDRYSLSCWNAIIQSSDHSNPFHFLIKRQNGLHLFADLEMNRFKAVIIPVSFWTSLVFRGGFKSLIALIWSGLTSIPLCVTMQPRNLSDPTPKEHLEVFRRSLCFLKMLKVLPRSPKCSNTTLIFTTISSTQISMLLPSYGSNILVIIL